MGLMGQWLVAQMAADTVADAIKEANKPVKQQQVIERADIPEAIYIEEEPAPFVPASIGQIVGTLFIMAATIGIGLACILAYTH